MGRRGAYCFQPSCLLSDQLCLKKPAMKPSIAPIATKLGLATPTDANPSFTNGPIIGAIPSMKPVNAPISAPNIANRNTATMPMMTATMPDTAASDPIAAAFHMPLITPLQQILISTQLLPSRNSLHCALIWSGASTGHFAISTPSLP